MIVKIAMHYIFFLENYLICNIVLIKSKLVFLREFHPIRIRLKLWEDIYGAFRSPFFGGRGDFSRRRFFVLAQSGNNSSYSCVVRIILRNVTRTAKWYGHPERALYKLSCLPGATRLTWGDLNAWTISYGCDDTPDDFV